MLQKGWRCLDCTVCEGCGGPSDEGRLLLCDDCDISYHTYCLDPPLETVPKGNWKCKWYVMTCSIELDVVPLITKCLLLANGDLKNICRAHAAILNIFLYDCPLYVDHM